MTDQSYYHRRARKDAEMLDLLAFFVKCAGIVGGTLFVALVMAATFLGFVNWEQL